MDASSASIVCAANILDLPNKNLRKIFGYLDQTDLVAVADVCCRFRTNSQALSSKFKIVNLHLQNRSDVDYPLFLNALRNFGASIEKVSVMNGYHLSEKEQQQLIECLHRYCSETLIEMEVNQLSTDAMCEEPLPVFHRVQKLKVEQCNSTDRFLKMLPLSFPALQVLVLRYLGFQRLDFINLCQKFENLVSITLHVIRYWRTSGIVRFLKCNPQLKKIHLFDRDHRIKDSIFQSFTKYVPELENLGLMEMEITREFISYFGQLRNLKTLRLESIKDQEAVLLLDEITAQNIPIENLYLVSLYHSYQIETQRLIDCICNCKTLKMLELSCSHLRVDIGICQISQQFGELTKLKLYWKGLWPYINDFVDMIRNMEKLQLLDYNDIYNYHIVRLPRSPESWYIDADTYMDMVHLVEKRERKSHLKVILTTEKFKSYVPEDLTKMHKDTVELVIQNKIVEAPSDFE